MPRRTSIPRKTKYEVVPANLVDRLVGAAMAGAGR